MYMYVNVHYMEKEPVSLQSLPQYTCKTPGFSGLYMVLWELVLPQFWLQCLQVHVASFGAFIQRMIIDTLGSLCLK